MKKKILVMMAVLALTVSSLAGCGSSSSNATSIPKIEELDKTKVEKKNFEFDDEGFTKVAANGKYELSVDKTFNIIRVKQVSTGETWTNETTNALGNPTGSLFNISIMNVETDQKQETSYDSKDIMSLGETHAIQDDSGNTVGARVEFVSDVISMRISMDIYLTEQGLKVKLPQGAVVEEDKYQLTRLEVLKDLAMANDTDDGYYLYPDGSGAIMEFKDSSHRDESQKDFQIYGDIQKYKNMLGEWDEAGEDVFMPIFGANVNNKSFLAIIEEGEETANVHVKPSTYHGSTSSSTDSDTDEDTEEEEEEEEETTTDDTATAGTSVDNRVNKIYATFVYRNSFQYQRQGSSVSQMQYDTDLIDVERVISYNFFEAGEDTTYSDMAVKYREYLIEECGLAKKTDDAIPVSVDIFMGINEEGTLRDSFKAVTTFEQAEKMVDELKKKGANTLEIQLKGWTKNGYFTDPIQFPVNSKIGGNKGLKSFASTYKSDGGIKITLETNLFEAQADVGGYDSNTEIVQDGNYSPISDKESNTYILSPNVAAGNLNQLLKDASKVDAAINGWSFYSLGQYVTYNYSKQNFLNKAQCKLIWEGMLESAGKDYDEIVVQGGNQYVLGYATKITDIPFEDSGYRMTTESVPVFQIATHGLVNYTGKALNLSSDTEEEKLKWVEYGYVPYFELTYEGSEELMHTDYSELFSSTFSSWVDEAADIYKDFNQNLKGVWNQCIVNHEELQEGVYRVTYEDGTQVYVNYNDTEYEADGITVDKNSYLVK